MAAGSRRYTDKELSVLLQRALERQEQARSADPAATGSQSGFTLEEIEQIAAEVGIDPEHLRAAAAEMEVKGAEEYRFRLFDSPRLELQQVVDGEVSAEIWEEMVAELRRSLGMGEQSQAGRSLEFNYGAGGHKTQFTATPREGRTRIQVLSEWAGAKVAFVLPSAYAACITTLLFATQSNAPVWGKLLFALLAGLSWFAFVHTALGGWVRNHQQRLGRMLGRLADIIEDSAEAEPQPRLAAEEQTDQEAVTRRLQE